MPQDARQAAQPCPDLPARRYTAADRIVRQRAAAARAATQLDAYEQSLVDAYGDVDELTAERIAAILLGSRR